MVFKCSLSNVLQDNDGYLWNQKNHLIHTLEDVLRIVEHIQKHFHLHQQNMMKL